MSVFPEDQIHSVDALALRDHSTPVRIFLCITQRAAVSLGGMPCGVQDRVRERQKGFPAANQRRRVCNDRPLVASVLLVLSLVEAVLHASSDRCEALLLGLAARRDRSGCYNRMELSRIGTRIEVVRWCGSTIRNVTGGTQELAEPLRPLGRPARQVTMIRVNEPFPQIAL